MRKALIAIMLLFGAGIIAAEPIGERIGETHYPYQNAGPTGRRIAVGNGGSIYVCWTNLLSWPYPPAVRQVYYNWRGPQMDWLEDEGYQVSPEIGAGYCNIDINSSDAGAIIYHHGNSVVVSTDDYPGWGIFSHFAVPNEVFPQNSNNPGICMWPQITVDRSNRIHVLMTENTDREPQRLAYTRSDDSASTWLTPIVIDTLINISGGIVSSPVSNRVAITFIDIIDSVSAYNYWPFFIISEDGEVWNVPEDIIHVPYRYANHDQRWGNNNQTAIFDYNDNLHIAWPVYGDSADWLLHYDIAHDTITAITELYAPPNHSLTSPMITQVSLSRLADSQTLVATWCQFAEGDTNAAGEYNGDIYFSRSDDSGMTWQESINITNSQTPGCQYLECSSEIYPCAPEEIAIIPQFTYMFDPYLNFDDYPDTGCSVMYFDINDLIDIPGIENNLPLAFALSQNYPNPFNAQTEIKFTLQEPANIALSIFDILGRKVETLLASPQPAGTHRLVWNAANLPSGVYFYKLQAGDYNESRQCLLLK